MIKILEKPAHAGIAGSLLLLLFYFALVGLVQDLNHAISQFKSIWYWIMLLSAGFGLQMALYAYAKKQCGTANVAASGGISGASMVACCAHHLTDALPILGLSAAAVFLARYQTFFIIIGVLSNLNGIVYMLYMIQERGRYGKALKGILKYDMKAALKVSLALSAAIAILALA